MPQKHVRRFVAVGVVALALSLAGSAQAGAADFRGPHAGTGAWQLLTSAWNAGIFVLQSAGYLPFTRIGEGIDPNGRLGTQSGDWGPGADPNGGTKADWGPGADPNGGGPRIGTTADQGIGTDPNGG